MYNAPHNDWDDVQMHDDYPAHPGGAMGGHDDAEIQRAIEESLRMGGSGAAYHGDDELQRILEMSKKDF